MKQTWHLYRAVLDVLPPTARRYLARYAILLGLLSILDAAALALLAIVIGPVVAGTQLTLPIVGMLDTVGLLLALALVCAIIIAKGGLALLISWRATRVFSGYELQLGSRLFDSYLESSWVDRLKRNSADIVRLTDSSVSTTISGFVLPATMVVGELLSFGTVVIVLAIAQPVVAVIALLYLGALGAFLFYGVTRRTRQAGQVALRFSLRSTRLITEMVGALKEVTLRGKAPEAAAVVRSNRKRTTRARANMQFLNLVPRHALDAGVVGGFALVGLAGYVTDGLTGALTAVALFGLAGFRMAPSIVRFQGIISQLAVSRPHAEAVIAEIKRSESSSIDAHGAASAGLPDQPVSIRFRNVAFRYADDQPEAVRGVDLDIAFGSTVAFVGSSGAGKSTIIDLLLGLIEPTSGSIEIDETPLREMRDTWRQSIGYVPQDVSLFDATISQNVALTWSNDLDTERVRSALALAQMLTTVEARSGGLDARVGERGLALSGGQRQRLGIARALYAEPLVLVMDEATSALDTTTEAAVTDAIKTLRGSMTIVTVAHRLSTVKEADVIFFMRGGEVVASGTFQDLVRTVPDFAEQARLAGLASD